MHIAVDTLGHLLALYVTLANEQDRAQVQELARASATDNWRVGGSGVCRPRIIQGNLWLKLLRLREFVREVVKLPAARKGFVLLPRPWIVERSFAWTSRFCRLARDYERLAETLVGLHLVAFAVLMLK